LLSFGVDDLTIDRHCGRRGVLDENDPVAIDDSPP
jgi:hypothetical protein